MIEATSNKLILAITGGDHNADKVQQVRPIVPVSPYLQMLLHDRSHVNDYSGEMTALHFATMNDSVQCARQLLMFGAEPHELLVTTGLWGGHSARDIADKCGFDDLLELFARQEELVSEGRNLQEDFDILKEAQRRIAEEDALREENLDCW